MSTIKIITKKEFLINNKIPEQEAVWNAIAKPWKTYVVKKIPIVEEFLKNKKGKIIDLGCGSGRNMIPNKDVEYYGVDFSNGQLMQAKIYIKKNKIKAKLFKLPIQNLSQFNYEVFDNGLFISTLHCLDSLYKRKRSLQEFHRVLKPKAEALISVWNSEDKRFKQVNFHGDIYMSWKELSINHMRYYYLFYKEEFLNLVEKTGFTILDFYSPCEKDRFSKKNWIIRVKK